MQKLEHGRHHEGTHGRGQGGRVPIQQQEQRESPQAWLRAANRPQAGGRAGQIPGAQVTAREPSDAARRPAGSVDAAAGVPPDRHPGAGADRDRNLPRRRRLRTLERWRARRRRGRRDPLPVRRARLRGPGRAGGRWRADPAARAARPRTPPARRGAVPDDRADTGAGGRYVRDRPGGGRDRLRARVLARRCDAGARRHHRTGRVLALLASDLPAGRRHPRGLPGDRGHDPDQRRGAGRDRARNRRGRARDRPGDPPLKRRPQRCAVTSSCHGGGP